MTAFHRVLIIGEDPGLVDYSDPAVPEGMSADVVWAGISAAQQQFDDLGWRADLCLTDQGETAEATVAEKLEGRPLRLHRDRQPGIRTLPVNLLLFEKVINAVHQHAPGTPIAFNTRPTTAPRPRGAGFTRALSAAADTPEAMEMPAKW